MPLELGMVIEDPSSGFVGAVVGWQNGLVVLEDRKGKRKSFPVGPGFWVDGRPVNLCIPRVKEARVSNTRRLGPSPVVLNRPELPFLAGYTSRTS